MTRLWTAALVGGAHLFYVANSAAAQDASAFSWEGEVELGNQSVLSSDIPGNEISDTYLSIDLSGEVALSERISLFAGLTIESLTDPVADRAFDDMGAYLYELGLRLQLGRTTLSLGKVSPSFGAAWDTTAGFFGAALAEDYELTEMLGGLADVDLGRAGMLSVGVFYTDDTALSKSAGFQRGQNTTSAGGAGNTGTLDNAALQWSMETEDTGFLAGLRYLSAGTGDVSDETGFVAGITHSFGFGLDVAGEIAAFEGFGGTADDATYVTLNAAYAIGELTLSGTLAQRDVTSAGKTDLYSLAAEYEFRNGWTIGGAVAHVKDAGIEDDILGINLVIPLGS